MKKDLIYDNYFNLPGETTSGFYYNDDYFDIADREFESYAGLAEQSKENWLHDLQIKLLSVFNFPEHEYSVFLMFEEIYCMMDVFIRSMSIFKYGVISDS